MQFDELRTRWVESGEHWVDEAVSLHSSEAGQQPDADRRVAVVADEVERSWMHYREQQYRTALLLRSM